MADEATPLAESRWIKVHQAVEESRTSKSTIHRMIADGTLAAARFRGTILIDRASFDAAFEPVTAA